MNKDQVTPNRAQGLPNVFSYCLENKKFRERWQDIFKSADEHIRDTRLQCKELFESEDWKGGEQFIRDHDETNTKHEAACRLMFQMIQEHFKKLELKESDQPRKLSQRVIYDNIMENYEKNPKLFIISLCRYLQEEERLLEQFLDSEVRAMEVDAEDQDTILRYMEECSKNIKRDMQILEQLEEDELIKQIDRDQYNEPSATDQQTKHIKDNLLDNLQRCLQEMETKAVEAETILVGKMSKFKGQLQLFYVDLLGQKPTIQTEVERGFSRLGEILYNNLQYVLPKLECLVDGDMVQSTSRSLYQCFERLLHGSFVVTEQQKHIIKVELGSKKRNKEADVAGEEAANQKFRCPKFFANVRLFACDNIDCKGKVKAQFCNEAEVNEKFNSGNWDSPCDINLKAKTNESTFEKKALATFKKMEIEKFERKPDVQVCEDKFRIVFTTKVNVAGQEILVPTISLPIVVTTGASQSCNVHGSLLWQCYSTPDAFQLPIETAYSLKWHNVFDMLNRKMLTLGGRDLCKDEKDHLGSRLMLEDKPILDEMDIPFRRFCVDKMMDIIEGEDKKKSATFWMWFLAVFNLTKSHLRDYWNDGLIAGFITKEIAEQRLKNLQHPQEYTYLLRFSDKVITDGQGQNLCGAISATVLYKSRKGKWRCFPTDPFKAETFKKMTLAQRVKSTCIHLEMKVYLLHWISKSTSLNAVDGKALVESIKKSTMSGEVKIPLLQWLYKTPTLYTKTEEAFKLNNTERGGKEERYKKFEEILIVSFSDLNLDEESSAEGKRDIKKAVGPSKKREAIQDSPEVIKNKRSMYSETSLSSPSTFSSPTESPQMQAIPQTVLEFSRRESQDSRGNQPQTTSFPKRSAQTSQQDIMDQSSNSVQPFNLPSIHPTLSRMLRSSNVNNFQTIDENALPNSCLSPDHGINDMQGNSQQQTIPTAVDIQQISPASSIYSVQWPSPASSACSIQSPNSNSSHVTIAPASTTSPDAAVQKAKNKMDDINEKMMLFEILKNKIDGDSSDSSMLSPGSQALSPQSAATRQSPQSSSFPVAASPAGFPVAASPAGSIQTDCDQSSSSQSMFSPLEVVLPTDMNIIPTMESVEAILNDTPNKNELIEALQSVFNEINSSCRSSL